MAVSRTRSDSPAASAPTEASSDWPICARRSLPTGQLWFTRVSTTPAASRGIGPATNAAAGPRATSRAKLARASGTRPWTWASTLPSRLGPSGFCGSRAGRALAARVRARSISACRCAWACAASRARRASSAAQPKSPPSTRFTRRSPAEGHPARSTPHPIPDHPAPRDSPGRGAKTIRATTRPSRECFVLTRKNGGACS